MTGYYLGQAADAVGALSDIDKLYDSWRLRAPRSYDALSVLGPDFQGNPFSALAAVQRYAQQAISGVYDDAGEQRERREFERDLAKLGKEQEKLLVALTQKLLVKRRDAIQGLLTG